MRIINAFLDVGVVTMTTTAAMAQMKRDARHVIAVNQSIGVVTVVAFVDLCDAMENLIVKTGVTKPIVTLLVAKANFSVPIQSFVFWPNGTAMEMWTAPMALTKFIVIRLVPQMILLAPMASALLFCGGAMVTMTAVTDQMSLRKCVHILVVHLANSAVGTSFAYHKLKSVTITMTVKMDLMKNRMFVR